MISDYFIISEQMRILVFETSRKLIKLYKLLLIVFVAFEIETSKTCDSLKKNSPKKHNILKPVFNKK